MQKSNYIPITIVDGFLEYPDRLREYALSLNCYSDVTNRWPGVRSESLYSLSPVLFNAINQKILDLFFSKNQVYQYNAISQFQIVNKKYQSGWVHQDPYVLTAILYLSPNSISGTSLYSKKNIHYNDLTYIDEKVNSYKDNTNNEEFLKLHNQNYEETLNVKGLYNRLLVFDSSIYHAAHDFFGNDHIDSRLTLTTFVDGIAGDCTTSLRRCKSHTTSGTVI